MHRSTVEPHPVQRLLHRVCLASIASHSFYSPNIVRFQWGTEDFKCPLACLGTDLQEINTRQRSGEDDEHLVWQWLWCGTARTSIKPYHRQAPCTAHSVWQGYTASKSIDRAGKNIRHLQPPDTLQWQDLSQGRNDSYVTTISYWYGLPEQWWKKGWMLLTASECSVCWRLDGASKATNEVVQEETQTWHITDKDVSRSSITISGWYRHFGLYKTRVICYYFV